MNVVVNGLMTNYEKKGDGKKVLVLLHGWGDSGRTFSKLTSQLNDYTIYTLDLPGFGGTQKPETAWSLNDYSIFVHQWLKKIGLNESYYLLGHSFGGAVAIVGTARGHLSPKKLVLVASAGVRGKKPLRKKALSLAAKAGRVPLFVLPPAKAQKIKLRLYKRIGSDVLLVPSMRETFVKTVKEDVRETASKIKVPTLLIYGKQDKQTPQSDGIALNHSIAGSRLEVVEGNHFIHQEQAQDVGQLIDNFIKGSS